MKKRQYSMIRSSMLIVPIVALLVSCSENATAHDDHHMVQIDFSYTPTSAVVNIPITLLFEVESEGEHVGVENPACEIHTLGNVTLTEGETGHYSGVHTFTQAGTYEVHFSYTLDGMVMEDEFSITVN